MVSFAPLSTVIYLVRCFVGSGWAQTLAYSLRLKFDFVAPQNPPGMKKKGQYRPLSMPVIKRGNCLSDCTLFFEVGGFWGATKMNLHLKDHARVWFNGRRQSVLSAVRFISR